MGMFDTFWAEHEGRAVSFQSKQFDCSLDHYQIGDHVHLSPECPEAPESVYVCIEDKYPPESDGTTLWAALLIYDGVYSDYVIHHSEADVEEAGRQLVSIWLQPETRVERLTLHLRNTASQRNTLQLRMERMRGLLQDFYRWHEEQEKPTARSTARNNEYLRKMLGPFRDFSEKPLDYYLSEELASYEGEVNAPDALAVTYYAERLRAYRQKKIEGQ